MKMKPFVIPKMAYSLLVGTFLAALTNVVALVTAKLPAHTELGTAANNNVLTSELYELVKELKSGMRRKMENSAAVEGWCKDALGTKKGMSSSMQRQLEETDVALKQVEVEKQRLASESRIAGKSSNEMRQQLDAADRTQQLARKVFDEETVRLERAANGTRRALEIAELTHDQELASVPAVPAATPAQSFDRSQDVPEPLAALFPDDDNDRISPGQRLRHRLKQMNTKLVQQRSAATSEHGANLRRLALFTDHLNSSIVEADAQIATIDVQASYRFRQGVRLRIRKESLQSLLEEVETSLQATQSLCNEESRHKGDTDELLTAETKSVSTLLRSSTQEGTEPDPEMTAVDEIAAAGMAAEDDIDQFGSEDIAPSFLQIGVPATSSGASVATREAMNQLRSLAERFPADGPIFQEGLQKFSKRSVSAAQFSVPSPSAEKSTSQTRDPLDSIRKFVTDSDPDTVLTDAAQRKDSTAGNSDVQDVFENIASRLKLRARRSSERRGRCEIFSRDAAVEEAAMQRSRQAVDAKLRIAKSAESEGNRIADYCSSQYKTLNSQLSRLHEAEGQAKSLADENNGRLQEFARQMLSQAAIRGNDGDVSATVIHELVQKLEEHRAVLQRRAGRIGQHATAVGRADKSLMVYLAEEEAHSRRLGSEAGREANVLTMRADAKTDDYRLVRQFRELVNGVCSKEEIRSLKSRTKQLASEYDAVRRAESASSNAASVDDPTLSEEPPQS